MNGKKYQLFCHSWFTQNGLKIKWRSQLTQMVRPHSCMVLTKLSFMGSRKVRWHSHFINHKMSIHCLWSNYFPLWHWMCVFPIVISYLVLLGFHFYVNFITLSSLYYLGDSWCVMFDNTIFMLHTDRYWRTCLW